ncbi:hypothetical protein CNEO4_1020008 [Clostridium neonatale]|nr:hypothetical protein CNEO_520037 [Clostridium neonatale]CAI3239228.1 hypothetical protein CNEO2_350012 [Clostridium neonatale]CAI3541740.1 hypothetical protein CNEO3_210007 [Clostridium neonatale]CAI3551930.1 hypothetical protein CNEO4_1020008 [Clostridium neonatale]CAI3562401.1 hypothetical protein CNEO4_1110008 [Clostridium neonatale]
MHKYKKYFYRIICNYMNIITKNIKTSLEPIYLLIILNNQVDE